MGFRGKDRTEYNYVNVTQEQLERVKAEIEVVKTQHSSLSETLGILMKDKKVYDDLESQVIKLNNEISLLTNQIEIQKTLNIITGKSPAESPVETPVETPVESPVGLKEVSSRSLVIFMAGVFVGVMIRHLLGVSRLMV